MTPDEFASVAALLRERSAIAIEPGKEYLVDSRLLPVAKRHGLASVAEFIAKLRAPGSFGLAEEVVEAMVTTETSFFRDVQPFDVLRKTVLPELIAARRSERKLAIWCAAASSGQEPYTLAIVIREWFPELANWEITFHATDISRTMLDRCREGLFSQIEVNRGLPAALLVKWFRQDGNRWRIDDRLRAMIAFKPLNLAEPWPSMPAFDLIFLRNVMIYFDVETKRDILRKMTRVLRPDGSLVLGGSETTLNLSDAFQRVESLKGGYYRLARKEA
jgi:chemotaxis protein methyltransferase CheR